MQWIRAAQRDYRVTWFHHWCRSPNSRRRRLIQARLCVREYTRVDHTEGRRTKGFTARRSAPQRKWRHEGVSLDLNRRRALKPIESGEGCAREPEESAGGAKGGTRRKRRGWEGRESPVSRMRRLRKSEILPWTPGNLGSSVTIFYLYEPGAAVVPIA